MESLVILQLDTRFPRVPGDIACRETYLRPVALRVVPRAAVSAVVTRSPDGFDLRGFAEALAEDQGQGLATTSCGFMVYFQRHLEAFTKRQVVSSALLALPELRRRFRDAELLVVTFDATVLQAEAYRAAMEHFKGPVLGLEKSMHLYQVIAEDREDLDLALAEAELEDLFRKALGRHPEVKAVLLECTNLPPYKAALRRYFQGEIVDCLSVLEAALPGLVDPGYL